MRKNQWEKHYKCLKKRHLRAWKKEPLRDSNIQMANFTRSMKMSHRKKKTSEKDPLENWRKSLRPWGRTNKKISLRAWGRTTEKNFLRAWREITEFLQGSDGKKTHWNIKKTLWEESLFLLYFCKLCLKGSLNESWFCRSSSTLNLKLFTPQLVVQLSADLAH